MARLTSSKVKTRKSSDGNSWSGRLFGFLFGAIFCGIGLLFTVVIAYYALRSVNSYFWDSVDVQILKSSVAIDQSLDSPFSVDVTYRYTVNGREFTSSQYSLQGASSEDYTKIYYMVERLKPGSQLSGYVNPRAPEEAILVRGGLWLVPLVLFPLIFVAIGGVVMYSMFTSTETSSSNSESISEAAKQQEAGKGVAGRVVGALFFSVFLVVGVLGFYFTFYKPFQQHQSAKSWEQIPAKVISSRIKTHEGEDSTTYSADIFYSYLFENKSYRSNRYSFFSNSSGKYARARERVNDYPAGKTILVFVDPANPAESVISLRTSAGSYVGLLTLLFALVGAGGIWAMLQPTKESVSSLGTTQARQSDRFRTSNTRLAGSGEVVLEPKASPIARLLALSFFALIWNGIIAIPVSEVVDSWLKGSPSWFLALAMTPFVLVGVGLLCVVGTSFLALFNPRPKIFLSSSSARSGENISFRWELAGKTSRITRLRVRLVGEEVAKYTRGTSTYTDTEIFYDRILAERSSSYDIATGSVSAAVPLETMHSFSADNNSIRWMIKIEGEIPRWPDVSESFELTIEPGEVK